MSSKLLLSISILMSTFFAIAFSDGENTWAWSEYPPAERLHDELQREFETDESQPNLTAEELDEYDHEHEELWETEEYFEGGVVVPFYGDGGGLDLFF